MSETIVSRLGQWAASLRYEQIPQRVVEKAKLQLFSVLGAIHGSARHELGKKIQAAVSARAAAGPASLIPEGKKADLHSAVFQNASLSCALDFDDYLLFGHTGHSAVCVSLALAQALQKNMKEALTAQVIANEIEGRLGASVVLGPHNGQAWSYIHLAGSAAAAAKLLGLDPERTAHAIAISLYQPTYVLMPGFMGPDSKATTAATPSVTGVQAAFLAEKGATGPLDIIEHPQGFLARFSYLPAAFFFTGLGSAWVTDTLAFKLYPGCAYIDTTVDALLEIRRLYREETGAELSPEAVSEVIVEATALTMEMDKLSRTAGRFDPLNPVSINFSIPGNAAIVLLKGRLAPEDLEPAALQENRDRILELSRKVKLVHDLALTLEMLEKMNEVLDIPRMAASFSFKQFAYARRKLKEQYQSELGFSPGELLSLIKDNPEAKARLFRAGKELIKTALPGRRPRNGDGAGYDLGRRPLDRFTMPFAARVTVKTKEGKSTTYKQDIPWAAPGHPLDKTRESVLEKYRRNAGKNLDPEKAEKLIRDFPRLQELTAGEVAELCCR